MNFEFSTPLRVVFGQNSLAQAGSIARELGSSALVVTGNSVARAQPLLSLLDQSGVRWLTHSLSGEPTTTDIRDGVQRARAGRCDFLIGFGGGSAIDAAKAIAALLTNGGELLDYLEVIGRGMKLQKPAAPILAIPTTAGAGAEATRNAVIASREHRVKASLRSPHLLPRVALVDPELTLRLPPGLTAATGLDALTQLIEPYVSVRANPFTDALCVDGMRRSARSLRRAFENGADAGARADLSLASLFGGLALANAGLGAVHGFAAPIGGSFRAPHGAVCAALLPHVMTMNLRALRDRAPESEALRRYDEVARLLTGRPQATAEDGVTWVRELAHAVLIPQLGRWQIQPSHFPALVEKAREASSMKANPVQLTAAEMTEILTAAT